MTDDDWKLPEEDLKLYMAPVWCGAWKIGTRPCGFCGSVDHKWLDCTSNKADPAMQDRARECGADE